MGDEKVLLASGLRGGSFVDEGVRSAVGGRALVDCVKMGLGRAWGLGVVRFRGLKLWPVMPSVLTLPFQRGFWFSWLGRGRRLLVGVAEPSRDCGEGEARLAGVP
jgi:hypothetical protein